MQKSAWVSPPSELPQAFVSATKTLFDQGLADPRGCEYREIEVPVGEPWSGDGGVIKTHGWVLPGAEHDRQGIGDRPLRAMTYGR